MLIYHPDYSARARIFLGQTLARLAEAVEGGGIMGGFWKESALFSALFLPTFSHDAVFRPLKRLKRGRATWRLDGAGEREWRGRKVSGGWGRDGAARLGARHAPNRHLWFSFTAETSLLRARK